MFGIEFVTAAGMPTLAWFVFLFVGLTLAFVGTFALLDALGLMPMRGDDE